MMQIFEKTWEGEIVEHKNFRDLGNYVIELPDFDDPSVHERAIAASNAICDSGKVALPGCTCMAKRNSKGEVIIGRNMDLDISQSPAYVFKTTYGKYKTACVTYIPNFFHTYEEVQKLDELEPEFMELLLFLCADCLNEKGLYIEANLREPNDKLYCYGLHSSRGEKCRADGTPWSELRACSTNACQHVSQNCATVREAVEFLNNSYDWYTVEPAEGINLGLASSNMCFMVGDATGEYGVIEFAQDEVSYIPYQFGQANYYITPKWNALDTYGPGHGRLAMVSKVIQGPDTLEEAMDAMKPIMWRNETMWLGESHRICDGSRLHPYNQIAFEDDEGTPQMDWRCEYVYQWPIMDDGRMLISARMYDEAVKSDYDPLIKQYFDDAIARGRLVVDDGSFKFEVAGEEVGIDELADKFAAFKASTDMEERAALKPYRDEYWRLLTNLGDAWAEDDDNFEALKAGAYASLHVRRDAEGNFDPSAMSQYDKLCAFYGKGVEKDEKPLRDDATIWTTSINSGTNCAQREIKIRFWENDDVIFHAKF